MEYPELLLSTENLQMLDFFFVVVSSKGSIFTYSELAL